LIVGGCYLGGYFHRDIISQLFSIKATRLLTLQPFA
jgi:hypothetical protein